MKVFISGLAIFALFMFALNFQIDYKNVENKEMVLKTQSDEILAGAALLWVAEDYGEGYIKFNDAEVIKRIKASVPPNVDYKVHVFDNSRKMRQYDEKGLLMEKDYTYPYAFEVGDGDTKKIITEPCLILETELAGQFYRMKIFGGVKEKIMRSSMYVVEGR